MMTCPRVVCGGCACMAQDVRLQPTFSSMPAAASTHPPDCSPPPPALALSTQTYTHTCSAHPGPAHPHGRDADLGAGVPGHGRRHAPQGYIRVWGDKHVPVHVSTYPLVCQLPLLHVSAWPVSCQPLVCIRTEKSGEKASKAQMEARLKQAQAAVKECYNAWCVSCRVVSCLV